PSSRLRPRATAAGFFPSSVLILDLAGSDLDDQLAELDRIARPYKATGGHMPEPRNAGRSGCFCCSATHELASASLLKPVYLPGRVPSSLTYTVNEPSVSGMIR